MEKKLDKTVNQIYVINYSFKRHNYMTSYLSEKRTREHAQYLADEGAKNIHIRKVNLWME